MIWVFLDLSLDREPILNSLSKSARIELEQRVGPNVLRKLGGIITIIFFNLLRLAGTSVRVTINQLFASTLKHSQAYPNRSCDYDYDWMYMERFGVNSSLLFFPYTSYQFLYSTNTVS